MSFLPYAKKTSTALILFQQIIIYTLKAPVRLLIINQVSSNVISF